jgi:hypothetical protein
VPSKWKEQKGSDLPEIQHFLRLTLTKTARSPLVFDQKLSTTAQ